MPYTAKYPTEAGAVNAGSSVVTNPYGEWSQLQQYFNMASDVQTYYDSVTRDISDAQSQPNYKSSKELQDYVSGLLNTLKKVKEQYGGSNAGTPGINPNAESTVKPVQEWDPVEEMKNRYEGSPADKTSSKIGDWVKGAMQNGGLMVLGIVVLGVAVAFTAKKQVIQVVKSAATDALAG